VTIEIIIQFVFGVGLLQQLYLLNGKLSALTTQMAINLKETDKLRERIHRLSNSIQLVTTRMELMEATTGPKLQLRR
jgi:phage shock protein A